MIALRFILLLVLTVASSACSAANNRKDPYSAYTPREAAFFRDAELLLFGKADSVYPLGGSLTVSITTSIDGVCYSNYFDLGTSFGQLGRIWDENGGFDDPPCDRQSFFTDKNSSLYPYTPGYRERSVFGFKPYANGSAMSLISRKSWLFIEVNQTHKVEPEWASYEVNEGVFHRNSPCRVYSKRDEFGGKQVLLSFARGAGQRATQLGVGTRSQFQQVAQPLAKNPSFVRCVMRGFAFARGLEGVAVVPDSFIQIRPPLPIADGVAINGCVFGPIGSPNEITCVVPEQKIGKLSRLLLLGLDSVSPERTTYSRSEFRSWISDVWPPGGRKHPYQINNLIPID